MAKIDPRHGYTDPVRTVPNGPLFDANGNMISQGGLDGSAFSTTIDPAEALPVIAVVAGFVILYGLVFSKVR